MSGYDLTREFDLTLANVWSAKHSQIYPELARLVDEGLIEQVGSGPRGRKVYATTEAGRGVVIDWLRKDDPKRDVRVESLLQGFFYWMLDADEAVALIEREKSFHQGELARYEAVRDFERLDWAGDAERRSQRIMLEAGIRYERGLVEWADWAVGELRHSSGSQHQEQAR
jgi:DNA-binding PadR family transcriptional regulator